MSEEMEAWDPDEVKSGSDHNDTRDLYLWVFGLIFSKGNRRYFEPCLCNDSICMTGFDRSKVPPKQSKIW